MANRFPLVLDVDSGNKIKELPSGDNLNLRESSIVNVQDITALGTIDAADIKVGGNKLVAQQFADLTDTPASFTGAENYFVKVNADGDGLEFRPLGDIGIIDVNIINVATSVIPNENHTGTIGQTDKRFNWVYSDSLMGHLSAYDGTQVFNAETGKITYAALQGAPTAVSEFVNDLGYLRASDLDETLSGLLDEGAVLNSDIKGSVFGDDSTLLVDGISGVIRGDIEFSTTGYIRATDDIVVLADGKVRLGATELTDTFTPEVDGEGSIGTTSKRFGTGYFVTIEAPTVETSALQAGTDLGIGEISSSTDVSISASNRVKIDGNVPFRVSSTTTAYQAGFTPQEGDIIYNSDEEFIQFYQTGEWVSLHQGDFTGNVTASSGTSNFNNVIIAGNLTVSGTTTTVDTANTTITDNVIVLNNGELGAGVTAGTSGIEIDRGSEANKTFVWDDSVDKWTLGSETLVADRFESVGVAAFVIDSPEGSGLLQIKAGNVSDTGNVIFINPYGSNTYINSKAETHYWATGPYGSLGNPYIDFKTAGAFTAHDGAYFVGNLTGDVKGSVFGDDSTVLVDSVNGIIGGTLATTMPMSGGAVIDSADTNLEIRNLNNFNVEADNVVNIIVDAQGAAPQWQFDNAGVLYLPNGMSIADNGNDLLLDASVGATNVVVFRTDGGDVFVDAAGVLNADQGVLGDVTGDVTGNIDNPTLTIGATNATSIAIGNSGSTTTINGTVQLPALVAGEITADNSISITTAIGDGNAISIGPQGTNRYVNLTADYIRFFGPITTSIAAQGGIVGDLKGSVVADDSTILVDSVSGTIPGENITGTITASLIGNVNGNVTGNVLGNVTGNVTGTLTGAVIGDVVGSVFADDSSPMVDAIDRAFVGDLLKLSILTAEPDNPTDGMIVIADGVSWNPLATGVQTLTVRLGGAWRQIQTA